MKIDTKLEIIEAEESRAEAQKDLGQETKELSFAELETYTHGQHYLVKCKCGSIVSQCRCSSSTKSITVVENCAVCLKRSA